MVSVKLFVEGGGKGKDISKACRRGFKSFLGGAGIDERGLSVVACGSRGNAYRDFEAARRAGQNAVLLVDAEGPVTARGPWEHLDTQDNWDRPAKATDEECHLMVQIMESWFLADPDALKSFYGQRFKPQSLPANPNIEQVSKQDVLDGLARATRDTTKRYNKGRDSFELLGKIAPEKVTKASPYAQRLIRVLSD